MEKVTGGPLESPTRRAATIARVGARYGFGFVFGGRLSRRRGPADTGRIGPRLRLSLEELGPTFAEFGRFLSARGDLATPVPFAEARAVLERELDNTLERLFVSFEEAPVRTGPFTQAHRAMLPGERPALVVVDRPGIRRDLLAMRPVADLTRRRIGPQLPLDPSLSVSEFAAHVNHRRDMFSSARVSRRLREMNDFTLRVPEIYRSLSTGRCITFEAPADPVSLDGPGARKVAGSLVRLALTEGIFLADPSPTRFALGGPTGEVWLLDPTEVFALDPERLRGVAEVLAAVRRGDVDGIVRALPLAGGSVPRLDADLRRELREALGSLGGPLWEEHSLAVMRARALEALRRGGAKLHDEVAQAARALAAAEEFSVKETRAAVEAAKTLVSRHRDPAHVAARTARRLAQPDTFADYPRQVHALLDELKDGEVEVRFRHAGLDDLIGRVDILANRLVFALLIAALIIGSSMLGIFVEGLQILGVSVFGLVGFVFAAVLGLLLLVGIIRSGRL
jgi:ubiquinone biosynthesis protein